MAEMKSQPQQKPQSTQPWRSGCPRLPDGLVCTWPGRRPGRFCLPECMSSFGSSEKPCKPHTGDRNGT